VLRTPTTDPSLVARMLAGNRSLFERNRDLGGTLYPFAALELSGQEWQQHYGTGLARAGTREAALRSRLRSCVGTEPFSRNRASEQMTRRT
jgi:hypothetical protein